MSSKTKTTATREETTPALLPKLRFPQFREEAGWDATILGELSEVVRGGSPRPIDGFMTSSADGLNWLKIGDVDKEAKFVTQTAEKVRREALSKTRVVNPGDLILSNSMSFGRPYILQITTCIHDGWIAITKISKKTNRDFLYYLISAPGSQSYFVDNAAGSGVQNLNADLIKALPVCFPTPAEQLKIAECLSSVDELMAAQARKVDALKTHKKGLMQQLFPREGEIQPRLRFPEFQNTGEWEPETLENLCSAKISYGIVQAGPHVPNGMPYIKSTDLNSELCLDNLARTSQGIAQKYRRSEVVPGDIVFSLRGNIGVTRILPEGIPVANLTQGTARIRTKGPPEFYFHALRSPSVNSRIQAVGKGSTFQEISLEALRNIRLFHPKPPEQQRIATCLSSLDALITAETQKHEALKTHKKGLMQQLFPSPEEVEA